MSAAAHSHSLLHPTQQRITPDVLICPTVLSMMLQVISTARTCNLILIVLDCLKPISHKRLIEKELEGFGIRLNKRPPAITFRKKDKGGITMSTTVQEPKLDLECKSLQGLLLQRCWPSLASVRTGPQVHAGCCKGCHLYVMLACTDTELGLACLLPAKSELPGWACCCCRPCCVQPAEPPAQRVRCVELHCSTGELHAGQALQGIPAVGCRLQSCIQPGPVTTSRLIVVACQDRVERSGLQEGQAAPRVQHD